MPSATRKTEPEQVINTTTVLVLVVIGFLLYGCSKLVDSPDATTESATPERTISMPYLRGLETIEAWGSMQDAGIDWVEDRGPDRVFHDLSYLHRDVETYDWKVWSTFPKPGVELEPGQTITVFALEDQEYDFFKLHRRMPKTGWKFQQRIGGYWGDRMAGIASLSEPRFVTGLAPATATREPDQAGPRTSRLPRRSDPSVETKLERYLRNHLKESDGYDQFMGTIPRPGQKLRPGQQVIVLFRPDPEIYPEVYGLPDPADNYDWDVYVDTDDDDDDGNIPGWLCPTRFC